MSVCVFSYFHMCSSPLQSDGCSIDRFTCFLGWCVCKRMVWEWRRSWKCLIDWSSFVKGLSDYIVTYFSRASVIFSNIEFSFSQSLISISILSWFHMGSYHLQPGGRLIDWSTLVDRLNRLVLLKWMKLNEIRMSPLYYLIFKCVPLFFNQMKVRLIQTLFDWCFLYALLVYFSFSHTCSFSHPSFSYRWTLKFESGLIDLGLIWGWLLGSQICVLFQICITNKSCILIDFMFKLYYLLFLNSPRSCSCRGLRAPRNG